MVLYFLDYPGLILLFYNYIYAIALSSSKNPDYFFLHQYYIFSQYIFHFVYFYFFYSEWNVANRDLYWRQVKTLWSLLLFAGHLTLFITINENAYFLGPFVSFYMGSYWYAHKQLLRNINTHLINTQDV